MADHSEAHALACAALRELATIPPQPLTGVVEQLARGLVIATGPTASLGARREALLRAIGAWADARERYARCLNNDPAIDRARAKRDAAHVAMLQAIDALERP